MSKCFSITLILVSATLIGCTSFTSTFLHRDESNTCWSKERRLRGVPITLKVPTHVRVDVKECFYFQKGKDGRLGRIKLERPVREMAYNYIYDEKVFTVDLKRPGSGSIDSNLKFVDQSKKGNEEVQYFDQIKTTVVDNTIKDSAQLINTIGTKLLVPVKTSAATGANVEKYVKILKSTVATEVFALDDPMLEQSIEGFLHRHLNCCHDCGDEIIGSTKCKDCDLPASVQDCNNILINN